MSGDERVAVMLKKLSLSYGYVFYRLPGFEEYSLYAENRPFIGLEDVPTFNAGGKLMALRPDVTISVVKNARAFSGTQKLFYDEKVVRKLPAGNLAEIGQMGVEVLGEVDAATEAEVLELMLKTLGTVSDSYVLDISHVGVVEKILDYARLTAEDRGTVKALLESKNAHDFKKFVNERKLDKVAAEAILTLINAPAERAAAFSELEKIDRRLGVFEELAAMKALAEYGGDRVNINFSIGGDGDYYNGLVFKGYIEGVPRAVLSGGRYDRLAEKFGRDCKAVGFALYLGELTRYFPDPLRSPDVVVVYSGNSGICATQLAKSLRKEGKTVLLSKTGPQNFSGEVVFAEADND